MSKKICLCGSQIDYKFCCEPFLLDKQIPCTPVQLMRSRYTAFSLQNVKYIQKTMQGKALSVFNAKDFNSQGKKTKWLSLEIIQANDPSPPELGFVEFKAQFSQYGKIQLLHEKSEFHLIEGRWYYVDGIYF